MSVVTIRRLPKAARPPEFRMLNVFRLANGRLYQEEIESAEARLMAGFDADELLGSMVDTHCHVQNDTSDDPLQTETTKDLI